MMSNKEQNKQLLKTKSQLQIQIDGLYSQRQTGSNGLSINLNININDNQKQEQLIGPNSKYHLIVKETNDQKSLSFKISFEQDKSLKQKEQTFQLKQIQKKQLCETMKETNTDSQHMQVGFLSKLSDIPQFVESNYIQTPKNNKETVIVDQLKTHGLQNYSSSILLSPLTEQFEEVNLSYSRTTYLMSNLKTLNDRIRDNYLRVERLRFDQWSQKKYLRRSRQQINSLSASKKNTSVSKRKLNMNHSMDKVGIKTKKKLELKSEISTSTKRQGNIQMEKQYRAGYLIKEIRNYLSTFKDQTSLNYQKLDANKSYYPKKKKQSQNITFTHLKCKNMKVSQKCCYCKH